MYICLLSLLLFAEPARPSQDAQVHQPSLAVANTKQVSDYRVFAELKRTLTETPVEVEVERWRQAFQAMTPAQREVPYRALPGLTACTWKGIDDGVDIPSLRLEFKTMLALNDPILAFSYQPQFRKQIANLTQRLAELPVEDDLIALPEFQPEWSEEIRLPQDFLLASPLAEQTQAYGFVQIRRTLTRLPGRITIKLQCKLTQASATAAERTETLAALSQIPADAPLAFEASVLQALDSPECVSAMNDLHEQAADPELRVWATIQRAAAFDELFLPRLASATLDAALAKSPDDVSLLRARIMLALPQRRGLREFRQNLVPYLDRLLEAKPIDTAVLKLKLAQLLSQPNFNEPSPSIAELKRAATLFDGLPPEHRDQDYAKLLMVLADFEAMERVLAQPKANFSELDQRVLRLTALAGRHRTEQLEQYLAKLEPEQVKPALDRAYQILVAAGHLEPLRVLAVQARALFEPKRLTEIEAAEREARLVPSANSPEGIYRQWQRAIHLRDRKALERLILPESFKLDPEVFETHIETAIREGGLKWPFGVETLTPQGDPETGYRLHTNGTRYFFAGNQDGYRLVSLDKSIHLAAHHILNLIERRQLESAYQWLDWIFMEEGFRIKWVAPVDDFWGDTTARNEETATLAAQILATVGPGRERVHQALRTAFEEATGTRRDELAVLFLLTEEEVDDFVKQTDFSPTDRESSFTWILDFWMCAFHGKCENIERLCNENEKNHICTLMQAGRQGGFEAVLAKIQSLDLDGQLADDDRELLLHFALLEPDVPEIPAAYLPADSREDLMRYYAERGMTEDVLRALSESQSRPSQGFEAYMSGRMAETFGEPQLARSFYAEIKPPALMMSLIETHYRLAKKHLDRLNRK